MSARIKTRSAKQGDLDGACGFYAITNAIHLLEPDLTRSEIFNIVYRSFLFDGDPQRFVGGTYRGTIKNTISRTLAEINNDYILSKNDGSHYRFGFTIPYWHSTKIRSRNDVISTLRQADHKKGCVAIMGYQFSDISCKYAHWTVVRGCYESGVLTHDSGDEKMKIPFSEIRVDSKQKRNCARPYNIHSDDIIIINTSIS